jgi:predicted nucleotidyltransferase
MILPQKIGLKESELDLILNLLRKNKHIQKVTVYGSRAKGNFRPGSDIDLVLTADQMDIKDLLKIENDLDDLMLPYKIDLSLFHHIEDKEILEHIKKVGIDLL